MQFTMNPFLRGAACVLLVSAALQTWSPGVIAATETEASTSDAAADRVDPRRIVREGVVIEFDARPARKSSPGDPLIASDWADIRFRITDEATGEPITGRYPAAWMDLAKAWEAKGDKPMSCNQRVQTYLQGIVGVRPMIDLNAHFLLVLNADPSISVIDPAVGISGITNLFAQINLDGPGADWAKTDNQKYLFVSMPKSDAVAVVDNAAFKVIGNVPAGDNPTRVELQRDGRYLWVGNNSADAETSGVTVIDTANYNPVKFITTGKGHHEITFSGDDRFAFVTNRNDGSVSIIDIQKLEKIKDLDNIETPISIAYSSLSDAVYVADGKTGEVSVIDAVSHEERARLKLNPGLGPMRFSQDGRWGIVVNPFDDSVYVIDATKQQLVHTLTIGSKPYQVTFTRSFAYIRSLGTAQVALIPLSQLDEAEKPQPSYVSAGQNPPGAAAQISISDAMVPSVKQAAAYIVNQAEGTVHYYMEGMAAPMGAFRNYGHQARAIEIVDRSLGEEAPGVYVGQAKIPVEGEYDIAFMMDTPRFLHCFSAEVQPNPDVVSTNQKLSLTFDVADKRVPAGSTARVGFTLADPRYGNRVRDVKDMQVMYYRSDGRGRTVVPARALDDGSYQAEVKIDSTGTYYVFVGARSQNLKYTDLHYLSLIGVPAEKKGEQVKAKSGGS